MERDSGLGRALSEGDGVILSTGANATVRRSYPKGYSGDVQILLDGAEESERASALTLPDEPPLQVAPELGDATAAQPAEFGEVRGPSRRMED